MRRHVIASRMGNRDREAISLATDEVLTQIDFVVSKARLEFGISDAIEQLVRLGIFPSELGIDMLLLAAHVHAADTRLSRDTESQDTWTREIRLVVPVSDPARWIKVAAVVERTLNFLTGDRWTLGFRKRPNGFERTVPNKPRLVKSSPFNSMSLFSGGLDSLIGAIDMLEQGNVPLFISHAGEGATSDSQTTLFSKLKKQYAALPFERLRLWMNFPDGLVKNVGSEKTTRGRSFLFFATGIFAGTGLTAPFVLNVPENGLIALNVPLDPLRLGALSTRTTHPFYMARWNELLSGLGISGKVENPYWDKTKGEMIVECRNRDLLKKILPDSLSCSSPTKGRWQGLTTQHCGYCLPCLIRRAAIRKGYSGISDPTPYSIPDLRAKPLDTRQAEGQQVRSFQYTIQRIQKKPALAALLINKPGPLSDESLKARAALAGVYRRGLDEIADLLKGVITSAG